MCMHIKSSSTHVQDVTDLQLLIAAVWLMSA